MATKEGCGIREKTYYCQGTSAAKNPDYIEIDLFPFVETKYKPQRAGKQNVTTPKQKRLNDKKSRRHFRLLAKSNFGQDDLHLTLSYENEPSTVEEAEHLLQNYLRRLKRAYKSEGQELKYIYITEEGAKNDRLHHHLFVNSAIDRNKIEQIWGLGYANSVRIQLEHGGIDGLVCYLSKDPKGRKRYTSSRNLIKPQESTSDTKTSRKKFQQLTLWPEDCEDMQKHFEKEHPEYKLVSVEKYYNVITCEWYIRAKMELKEEIKRKASAKSKKQAKKPPKSRKRERKRE